MAKIKTHQEILDSLRAFYNRTVNNRDSRPPFVKPTFSDSGVTGRITNDSVNDAPNGNNFQTIIDSLSQTGNIDDNSLQTMLDFLTTYFAGDPTAERNDMFYQFMLQWLSNSEQRGYDYNMLQESRDFNNPLNQLLRYTSAGISRDAAIQMLAGSAGNIGSGSSGVGASAPSVSAPSGTMDLNRAATIYNGIYGGIAAINQLMQSGLSFAQGLEQVQMMKNQNIMSNEQVNAFNSVQELSNALFTLQQSGDIKLEDYSNINDVLSFIRDSSATNDKFAKLVSSPAYKTATGSLFGREYLNQYWNNSMRSRSDGDLYNEYVRSQKLNNALTEINTSKVGAELSLIDAQTNTEYQALQESVMRVATMQADIEVKNAQGDWIKIQTDNYQRLADAQYNQLQVSIEGQEIQNQINRDLFEINHAGFPMLKQAYIDECTDKCAYWSTINDPHVREERIYTWLLDAENAHKAAYVKYCYDNAVGSFATDHPNFYKLMIMMKTLGVTDALKSSADGVGNVVGAAYKFVK